MADTYQKLSPFCGYVNQALPAVYEDTMGYVEAMGALINMINEVLASNNGLVTAMDELKQLQSQLQEYVDNYFDNLDVQQEINQKLDEMAEDGTLASIIDPLVESDVNNWLNANIDSRLTSIVLPLLNKVYQPDIVAITNTENYKSFGQLSPNVSYAITQSAYNNFTDLDTAVKSRWNNNAIYVSTSIWCSNFRYNLITQTTYIFIAWADKIALYKWINGSLTYVYTLPKVDSTLTVAGDAADASITGAKIDTINQQYAALTTRVNNNTNAITENTSDIAQLQTDYSNLRTQVNNNTTNIATNTSNLNAHEAAITQNISDIAALQDNYSNLRTQVNNNTTDINTNTANIASINQQITQILEDIETDFNAFLLKVYSPSLDVIGSTDIEYNGNITEFAALNTHKSYYIYYNAWHSFNDIETALKDAIGGQDPIVVSIPVWCNKPNYGGEREDRYLTVTNVRTGTIISAKWVAPKTGVAGKLALNYVIPKVDNTFEKPGQAADANLVGIYFNQTAFLTPVTLTTSNAGTLFGNLNPHFTYRVDKNVWNQLTDVSGELKGVFSQGTAYISNAIWTIGGEDGRKYSNSAGIDVPRVIIRVPSMNIELLCAYSNSQLILGTIIGGSNGSFFMNITLYNYIDLGILNFTDLSPYLSYAVDCAVFDEWADVSSDLKTISASYNYMLISRSVYSPNKLYYEETGYQYVTLIFKRRPNLPTRVILCETINGTLNILTEITSTT